MIEERGPWRVATYLFPGGAVRVDIQSDDFTHDAVLTVTGDFKTPVQKIAYAEEIARRLNSVPSQGDS